MKGQPFGLIRNKKKGVVKGRLLGKASQKEGKRAARDQHPEGGGGKGKRSTRLTKRNGGLRISSGNKREES